MKNEVIKMLLKLINNEKGSISLFLIVVITALFFLNIVLIDFSRIMTGKFTSEKSVKAAIRSELSRFDQALYKQYGLFGYLESNNNVFEEILINNLSNVNKGFNYLQFDIENIKYELNFEQEIILLPVIKNQILEEMKYQAPINFQQKIFNKLEEPVKHVADSLENYDLLQEMTDKFLNRNDLMREAFDSQIDANKLVPEDSSQVISSAIGQVELIVSEELSIEEVQVSKNEITQSINHLSATFNQRYSTFNTALDEARNKLASSEKLNDEITNLLNRYDESIDYKDTILSRKIYEDVSESISLQERLFRDLSKELNQLNIATNLFNNELINSGKFLQSLESFQGLYYKYNNQFRNLVHTDNWISHNINNFNKAIASVNRYYDELVEESENSLLSLKELTKSLKTLVSTDEAAEFINSKYLEFLLFNDQAIETMSVGMNINIENINDESQGAFARVKSLTDNYLIEIRDSIYYEEYAFDRFNSFADNLTGNTFEVLMSGNFNEDLASSIHISRQELEYIIYKNTNSSANITSAIGDIYLLRFLFNTFDALLNPAIYSSANPIVIMLEASAYAFKESISDLVLILKGDRIPLMKKVPAANFGYVEYLKILYLCRGAEDEQLLRQLALIEYATGKDLQKVTTYGVVDVEVAMDLWFLPQLSGVVGLDSGIIEKDYGRAYIIKRRTAYGY